MTVQIRILESPADLAIVENLQRLVWPGNETEIVPVHMMRAVVSQGGLVIGAFRGDQLVGFVFGFPGIHSTPEGPRLFHASHMAGVHPDYRDSGLGFRLKRAQWQMVRQQGLERVSWTYDPLQSRNANLNIAKLGAVCNTYLPNYYGEMRDGVNVGVPSDRFKVDWWVNSNRVVSRLHNPNPRKLDLAHYLDAGTPFVNATQLNADNLVFPLPASEQVHSEPLLLLEIPAEIMGIRAADPDLAVAWSGHVRELFSRLFAQGYIVTDFVYLAGALPRSFYVLSHGDSTF